MRAKKPSFTARSDKKQLGGRMELERLNKLALAFIVQGLCDWGNPLH
jgi:hypothetical protein